MRPIAQLPLLLLLIFPLHTFAADVTLRRLPDGGLEPQVAIDAKGVLHLIYFTGQDKAGDIVHRTSTDAGKTFSPPKRVNSVPSSAMIIGAVRGPQLALASKD